MLSPCVVQDFVHYVLKHSMVVLMTARDESTSFKIFSTLNGRGVDLAVIDKLKPELLQVRAGCSLAQSYVLLLSPPPITTLLPPPRQCTRSLLP
jgi:hypothetical protein